MADKLIIARTAEEAVRAKNKSNVYMAGGTEVMRLGSAVEADAFVSVRKVPYMREIASEDGKVRIGAACTFQELVDNKNVPAYLKEAALFLASRTRRNMSTIGGNIAVARDDSFLLPTLIAAGAELVLKDVDSEETISAAEYVANADKYKGKLILSVSVPAKGVNVKSSRSANTAQSHARLTAALSERDGRYTAVAAVKNSGIYILGKLSSALSDSDPDEEEIIEIAKANDNIKLEDDLLYGGADYRRYLIGITFALMYEEMKGGRS